VHLLRPAHESNTANNATAKKQQPTTTTTTTPHNPSKENPLYFIGMKNHGFKGLGFRS
jgi:hypothetical protein